MLEIRGIGTDCSKNAHTRIISKNKQFLILKFIQFRAALKIKTRNCL